MENSKKTEFFKFGKLENQEDPDSEDSVSHFEDSVADVHGIESLSERLERDLDKLLSKEASLSARVRRNYNEIENVSEGFTSDLEKPIRKEPFNSTHVFSSASNDDYERRNNNGWDQNATQTCPKYGVNLQKRSLLETKLRGNWSFRCDNDEINSDGLTEADIVWIEINKLIEKEPSVFVLEPLKFPSRNNFTSINIYTPDYRDKEFIQKTADLLRANIYFPYIMYYYESGVNPQSIYMHTPNGEFYRKNESNSWEIADRQ